MLTLFAAAAALAAAPVMAGLCGSKTPPTGFRIAVGYAQGPRARALENARDAAIDYAVKNYASEWTPLQVAAFRRQVFDWSEDNWQAGAACVRLAIADEAFKAQDTALAKLTSDLKGIAGTVSARAHAVEVDAPVWDQSGCAADIGAALRTTLIGQLSGVQVSPGASRLGMRLAAVADGVSAAVTLDNVVIGAFTFPLTLFRLEPGETGKCAANAAIGLRADDRRGADGLSVRVRFADVVGEGCEGDPAEPVVTTSTRARVQVFSVDDDSVAHFVGVHEVSGTQSLGVGSLAPSPDGSDERLVAVALPAGQSFGATEWFTDYCRMETSFDIGTFPASAAVGTTTFIVRPSGTRGCAVVNSTASDDEASAPPCR